MDDRRAMLTAAAALIGLVVGWVVTHGVLMLAGYEGDPSRGAAFTGSAICGVASAAAAQWFIARRPRPD